MSLDPHIPDISTNAGGHTLGFAQCFTFKRRLFNFDGAGNPDPQLDTSLLGILRTICPDQSDSNSKLVSLDDETSTNKFDNSYFKLLVNNSGLLQSDQMLMADNRTASCVVKYSRFPGLFFKDFAASMVKMSKIGVITGRDGEIRRSCRVVN